MHYCEDCASYDCDCFLKAEIEQLRTQLAEVTNKLLVARDTLKRIHLWNEHTPSFSINYGSNGVRDMYRNIAKAALAKIEDIK